MFLPYPGNGTLNKMSAKFLIFAAFLCCSLCQLATATEDAIREAGIKKLADHRKVVDEYVFKLSFFTENDILNSQTYTRIDHSGALKQRTDFEIKQITDAYRFIAELMGANKYVIQCMNETTQKAHNENQAYHFNNCYEPVHKRHVAAAKEKSDKLFEWSDKKSPMYKEYTKLYDEAIQKIKKSDSPTEIKSAVDEVTEKGEKLIEASKQAIAQVRKIQMDLLVFADDRLAKVREFCRKTVDNLSGALQNCFLVKSPFFKLRDVFIKDNLL